MQQRMLRRKSVALCFAFLLLASLWGVSGLQMPSVHASSALPVESNGAALTPFMGWSTWDYLETPTQAGVEAQAQAEASKLKAYGYDYTLVDDGWYLNPATTVDQNGRWVADTSRFPNGLSAVASYVHGLGLKFGAYLTPGIPVAAVNENTPIAGTSYHAKDIVNTSKHEYNYNYGGSGGSQNTVMYYIDYSKPGAQAYINSWADLLASWGVDFLKMDGVGDWDISDIQAWSQALKQSGRTIVFDLSNKLDIANVSTWQEYSNAWRIGPDVECYCSTQINWEHVARVFGEAASWNQYAESGGWNDLDALQLADGSLDGLSNDERQTYMSLWAIESAPLYAGDDLTHIDSYGLSLLTNTEVIALDQAGHAAHPLSQSTNQQVWVTKNGNGTYTIALFNLGTTAATVTANWSALGFSGSASVHDLWSHSNLGTFNSSFSATLNEHASRLLTITPSSGVVSYEAESSANTLTGGAHTMSCSACSGSEKVGDVGNGGTLQFNNVNVSQAGTYTLMISYIDGDAGRSAQMSVNGGTATTLTFTGTNNSNWNYVQSKTVSITLKAGSNTLKFSNASAWAPDFDRITVS